MKVPSHIEKEINKKIASGKYQSQEDVLTKAIMLLTELEEREEEISNAIYLGKEQLAHGEGIPSGEVFAELRARNQSFRKKNHQ